MPVYAVRGNHESYYEDQYVDLTLNEKYSNWIMPSLWYSKKFDLGDGTYFAMIFIDSVLLQCSTLNLRDGDYSYEVSSSCDDDEINLGNE